MTTVPMSTLCLIIGFIMMFEKYPQIVSGTSIFYRKWKAHAGIFKKTDEYRAQRPHRSLIRIQRRAVEIKHI